MISFAVVLTGDQPAPEPRLSGDSIEFGGHTFAVGEVPGEYSVDGSAIRLSEDGLHIFQDGAYYGADQVNGF